MNVLNTQVSDEINEAIMAGMPNKWKTKYQFLQMAVKEKLESTGLLLNNDALFVHYKCIHCSRELYVTTERAGQYEWVWCTLCGKKEPHDAMERLEIVLAKNIPSGKEIKR